MLDTGKGKSIKEDWPFEETELGDVAGCLRYSGLPKTLEEMEKAIMKGVMAKQNDNR